MLQIKEVLLRCVSFLEVIGPFRHLVDAFKCIPLTQKDTQSIVSNGNVSIRWRVHYDSFRVKTGSSGLDSLNILALTMA